MIVRSSSLEIDCPLHPSARGRRYLEQEFEAVFSVEFGPKPGSSFHADKASLMTRFLLVRHF